MPTCKAELDCLQEIDSYMVHIEGRLSDVFNVLTFRSDSVKDFLIPIIVLLIIILIIAVLAISYLYRRERVRFVTSARLQEFSPDTEVLVQ